MAVVDKYTDTNVEAGKITDALKGASGTGIYALTGVVTVASGDDDTSVYRVFANVPSNYAPISIGIHNTAITSGTDYDLGLYYTKSGSVVDADILADGLDMSSARTIATANNAGMTTLTLGEIKTLATLSAETDPKSSYDICFTANTVGSANGTIRVTALFVAL